MCVCVCVYVSQYQYHNGVAVGGILNLATVEERLKRVCGAPEIFDPDESFVLFIIMFCDRM